MNTMNAASAYHKVGVESGVSGADPHRVISMLYQGALLAVANAKSALLRKDIPAKCAAISKAISIVAEGLNGGLDFKMKHELVGQLASLYDYILRRLVDANIKNDIAILDEITSLLTTLKSAWDEIRPQVVAGAPVKKEVSIRPSNAYASMVA